MLQKGYLKQHSKHQMIDRGSRGPVNHLLLFGGFLLIIASLIVLLINFPRVDAIIAFWLPVLIIGVVLVFSSIFVKARSYRSHR